MTRASHASPRRSPLLRGLAAVTLGSAFVLSSLATSPVVGHSQPEAPASDSPASGPAAAADRVIVTYREASTEHGRAAARRAAGVDRVRGLGRGNVELVSVRGRPLEAAIAALANQPDVAYAEPDYIVHADVDYEDEPLFESLWGLHNTGQTIGTQAGTQNVDIDAREAAEVTRGDPTLVVAVIDDGVDFSHPDLSDRRWTNPGESGGGRETNGKDDDLNGYVDDVHGYDFFNNDGTVHDPVDEDYHGTHVAGTIAASLNGIGVVGVAPDVKIMALKFLGPTGGFTSDAIRAINYAKAQGVTLSNNSWGGPGYSQSLKDAIDASQMLFVTSAGNKAYDNDTSPYRSYPSSLTSPNILSVAAVENTGAMATYSNYGATSVDISAPGTRVLSTLPVSPTGEPQWGWLNGTSMAAPHATGVAALAATMRQTLRTDPAAWRLFVMNHGKPTAATVGRTVTGDIVDADAVVDPMLLADTTSPSGSASINSNATYTPTPTVTIAVPVAGSSADVTHVRLSNNGTTWRGQGYAPTVSWSLTSTTYGGTAVDGVKSVYVQWRDAAGNWSAVATDTITLDTLAPAAQAPTHAFVQNSQVATGNVPVRISWSASDGSGISKYELRRTTDGGASWTTVPLPSATATSVTLSLGGTYTYGYQVRAMDRAGNVGPWVSGASFKLRAYQENSAGVTYTGTWTRTATSDSYGGYVKSATAYDARARLTFTGRSVAFLAPRGPTMGSAYVYVDGTRVATINLYASAAKGRNVVYVHSWATAGSHTIEIRVLATSGHPKVSVDGFIISS